MYEKLQLLLENSNQGIMTPLRAVSGIPLHTAYSLAIIPAQQKTINRHIFRITEDYQILPTWNDALFNQDAAQQYLLEHCVRPFLFDSEVKSLDMPFQCAQHTLRRNVAGYATQKENAPKTQQLYQCYIVVLNEQELVKLTAGRPPQCRW